jgi:hypothetical protein
MRNEIKIPDTAQLDALFKKTLHESWKNEF